METVKVSPRAKFTPVLEGSALLTKEDMNTGRLRDIVKIVKQHAGVMRVGTSR